MTCIFRHFLISTRDANARHEKSGAPREKGQSSGGTSDAMSLDETNALRAQLGLKPLQ